MKSIFFLDVIIALMENSNEKEEYIAHCDNHSWSSRCTSYFSYHKQLLLSFYSSCIMCKNDIPDSTEYL